MSTPVESAKANGRSVSSLPSVRRCIAQRHYLIGGLAWTSPTGRGAVRGRVLCLLPASLASFASVASVAVLASWRRMVRPASQHLSELRAVAFDGFAAATFERAVVADRLALTRFDCDGWRLTRRTTVVVVRLRRSEEARGAQRRKRRECSNCSHIPNPTARTVPFRWATPSWLDFFCFSVGSAAALNGCSVLGRFRAASFAGHLQAPQCTSPAQAMRAGLARPHEPDHQRADDGDGPEEIAPPAHGSFALL